MNDFNQIDLNRLRVFKTVIDMGSYSKAATLLKITKSNVSRQITNLESQLQTQLIYRTTRQLQLTDAGKKLYHESYEALAKLEAAISSAAVSPEEYKGWISFTAPEDMTNILTPLMTEFMQENPKIKFDCRFTNEVLDLVKNGIDLALRMGKPKDSTFITRKIGGSYFGLVATPTFMERFSRKFTISDLSNVPFISFRATGNSSFIQISSSTKKNVKVPINPVCVVDNTRALKEFALLGTGITFAPLTICHNELLSGELVRVLPEWSQQFAPAQLMMPPQKEKNPAVKAFAEHLIKNLKDSCGVKI